MFLPLPITQAVCVRYLTDWAVVVPCHCREEWEWLKRQSARHKTLGCSSSETLSSVSSDEATSSEEGQQAETSGGGTEQQQVFVELVAATARRLFSYMEVSPQEALTHR
jgi:hypothetical protein